MWAWKQPSSKEWGFYIHIPLESGGYSNAVLRHSYARYVYSGKEVESHPVTGKDGLPFGVIAHRKNENWLYIHRWCKLATQQRRRSLQVRFLPMKESDIIFARIPTIA